MKCRSYFTRNGEVDGTCTRVAGHNGACSNTRTNVKRPKVQLAKRVTILLDGVPVMTLRTPKRKRNALKVQA